MEDITDNNPEENNNDPIENTPEVNPIQQPMINQLDADILAFNQFIRKIKGELKKVIVGQDKMINLLMVGLFADGHIILEGVPGIAKTLTAKLFSKTISVDFSRIQFTPDLMPADVIGTMVFNAKTTEFDFKKGPIFSNIVLIDEINRAPAKTQSALFEVMEERQISVDGTTYKMEEPYMVLATQNPIEQEGTYKLPEAQLDRFVFRIRLNYPSLEEEQYLLRKFNTPTKRNDLLNISTVINADEIKKFRGLINQVHISDQLTDYIAQIIHNTRNNGDLFLGASPRASLAIMQTSKAFAAIHGRSFVTPDDIQQMCYPVLNHRVILNSEKEIEGTEPEEIIKEIITKIEVPR
ncbi:AAA family ATPase [Flexithrix dorotheae]|uniref:AAA family ATPase n=1 Tax=Flexithrix dorotheae TaxID=70993 RepID=UPI00036F7321